MNLIKTHAWYYTSTHQPRGFIKPHALTELWFHVGTACNLACPFCLEGSEPGDKRLEPMTLADAQPYLDQALQLGVKRFSFTGGEPFVIKGFPAILAYAAAARPCLVLTNGTKPLLQRLQQIIPLRDSANPVHFRISIDYPDETQHDRGRGAGTFKEALTSLRELIKAGFQVSVARQMDKHENKVTVEEQYRRLFRQNNIEENLALVAFPDFLTPHSIASVPEITETCMTQYHTEESRQKFMCAYSKMIVKQNNVMSVYACTLVDDDPNYNLGSELMSSMENNIPLKHHRCYSCFAFGASCSG